MVGTFLFAGHITKYFLCEQKSDAEKLRYILGVTIRPYLHRSFTSVKEMNA